MLEWRGTTAADFEADARWRRADHRRGLGDLWRLRAIVDDVLIFRRWSKRYGWCYEVATRSMYGAGLVRPEWHLRGHDDWRDAPPVPELAGESRGGEE